MKMSLTLEQIERMLEKKGVQASTEEVKAAVRQLCDIYSTKKGDDAIE